MLSADADAAHLRSVPLAALRLPLVPLEQSGALVQRLLDERAGDVLPDVPGAAGGPNSAFPTGALMRRIATWSIPSLRAAFAITGSINMCDCVPPG